MSEATQKLVEGQVETVFAGERQLKGKAEPLRVFTLIGIRPDATRFAAAASRGFSPYVGREREFEILERNFAASRSELRVVDISSEPGMGKSRLVHEFRQRLAAEGAFILSGGCSPDGTRTPFLPFIEVARGAFLVKVGEAEKEVARKLETGLSTLGLNAPQNLGIMLNLLGLSPPVGALAGLDGLLIGLRTRDLMLALLEASSRVLPLALLIEDLHWIDSSSEELLGKIVESEVTLRALVLLTRRSEYRPPWASQPRVAKLALEPLPSGNMRQLVQTRLGVEAMPDALARVVTERAEGNPLFGEEIATFLADRGIFRSVADKIEFDPAAAAEALPSSVQSLLTARVDRLAPERRALLQAASVIGRRFDLDLLAAAAGTEVDIRQALAEIEPFDLVHALGGDGEWAFKHALLRDVLYQSLLTAPRTALHLRIAEEIERRSGNRLPEVAETLAHHYGLTDRADKALAYLAMAGKKSLGLYAFEEAGRHFAAAITLLDKLPECATDTQVASLLADFALFSDLTAQRTRACLQLMRERIGIGRRTFDVSDTRGIPESVKV